MTLSITLCGLETCNTLEVLEQSSDGMYVNMRMGSRYFWIWRDSFFDTENKETDGELMGDARAKRPRLEDQGDWQSEEVDDQSL
jgi:hypothetical protein